MKTFKEQLEESIENKRYILAMNTIKRAIGDETPTKEDLEEFIKISAKKNGFDEKDFSKFVKANIVHSMKK